MSDVGIQCLETMFLSILSVPSQYFELRNLRIFQNHLLEDIKNYRGTKRARKTITADKMDFGHALWRQNTYFKPNIRQDELNNEENFLTSNSIEYDERDYKSSHDSRIGVSNEDCRR